MEVALIEVSLYIVSTCEQHFSNEILQTGAVACKRWLSNLPVHIIVTIRWYKFSKVSYAQKLDQKSVYFVTGNFTILDTEPLELAISSCKDLPISKCLQTDSISTRASEGDERIVNNKRRWYIIIIYIAD